MLRVLRLDFCLSHQRRLLIDKVWNSVEILPCIAGVIAESMGHNEGIVVVGSETYKRAYVEIHSEIPTVTVQILIR